MVWAIMRELIKDRGLKDGIHSAISLVGAQAVGCSSEQGEPSSCATRDKNSLATNSLVDAMSRLTSACLSLSILAATFIASSLDRPLPRKFGISFPLTEDEVKYFQI
jgi:hypothetical protein